jgi:hypothetical protein
MTRESLVKRGAEHHLWFFPEVKEQEIPWSPEDLTQENS